MNTNSNIASEITVRISLRFQDSPEVHTLLAMTPVRERRKLIYAALQQYIKSTAHPAGNIENQIEEISRWLRSRSAQTKNDLPHASRNHVGTRNDSEEERHPSIREGRIEKLRPEVESTARALLDAASSRSAERWLEK